MSWRHRGFTWKPQSSLTLRENANECWLVEFAYLSHSTCIKGRQVHPLIRFLLRSREDEKCADLHKPFIFYLFLVGVTVQSAESLSAEILSETLKLKQQILKEQISEWKKYFCPSGCGRFLSTDDGPDRWQPCLPGQPWVLGWRSIDRPVPNPCAWMISFSERGVAYNRVLLRCLFSRKVHEELTKLWMAPFTARSCSSVSSVLVRVSRPKPVSWRPLLWSKLIVLRARQPLPCTPWLSCRFTKPRHSNGCTRVVPPRGLMQELCTATDFALRATKVTVWSLGKAMMSSMVVQEHQLWLNLAEMKDVDKARFLKATISQVGLFGDTIEGFAQQFSAVQQ